jgi:hypothetical protein
MFLRALWRVPNLLQSPVVAMGLLNTLVSLTVLPEDEATATAQRLTWAGVAVAGLLGLVAVGYELLFPYRRDASVRNDRDLLIPRVCKFITVGMLPNFFQAWYVMALWRVLNTGKGFDPMVLHDHPVSALILGFSLLICVVAMVDTWQQYPRQHRNAALPLSRQENWDDYRVDGRQVEQQKANVRHALTGYSAGFLTRGLEVLGAASKGDAAPRAVSRYNSGS